MADHPNVDVVRRLYAAFEDKDLDTILAATDTDVVCEQTTELPWGGRYEGHDGLGEFFMALLSHIDSTLTIHDVFAAGDEVVQVGRTKGTVLATGALFDVPEVHVLTVVDGLVTRFESRIDTPTMLEALAADG